MRASTDHGMPHGRGSGSGREPVSAQVPELAAAHAGARDAVGLVIGTVPATPLQFSVGLAQGQYLQLDDVVVTFRELPGLARIQLAGVVTEVEAVQEGARFASDVFLVQQGALPAEVCEVAEVTVTRVEPEVYVPPLPGAPVTRATGQQRETALYFDEMGGAKVPVGLRPRRAAGIRQLRVPRRHPRRARVDLRCVRHRDQDLVRDVPAAFDHQLRRAGGRGAQHQGADLQRQGRGPAVPRLREQPAHRRCACAVQRPGAARAAVRECPGLRPAAPR